MNKLMNAMLGLPIVVMMFLTVYVSSGTYEAPMGSFVGTPSEIQAHFAMVPVNVPTFKESYTKDYPGCVDISNKDENVLYPNFLVVDEAANVKVMDFDKAWRLTHNGEDADDIWVIGICR